MSEHWTDRLSEYIDGDLPAAEVERLERHVAGCPPCAATLEEIRAIVVAAGALPDHPPARDRWPDIEARLVPRRPGEAGTSALPLERPRARAGRRLAFTIPQLLAAGIALILFSVGGAWLTLGGAGGARPVAAGDGATAPSGTVAFAATWETAVAELEAEFDLRRSELDPATSMVVERNLAIIDRAIAEARQALEADPSSGFLNGYVADAMRRKVDLLRQATRIQRTES